MTPTHRSVLADRRAKAQSLRDRGIAPYPHAFPGVASIAEIRTDPADGSVRRRVAGRLVARRDLGRTAFLDIEDGSGVVQVHLLNDVLGAREYELALELDLGDIVGVDGGLARTRRGSLALRADAVMLLAKSLRPPPSRWHGMRDSEGRARYREALLMSDAAARDRFTGRSRAIGAMRAQLEAAGFMEVETPVLQPVYGGAEARPFVTHHNALDRSLFLRIAPEIYLKRLIVGGFERVFEIGKNFRNEGISPKHNPEFTALELYEAYADYSTMIDRCEALVSGAAAAVGYRGDLDFTPPWPRETYAEAISSRTGIDIEAHRDEYSLRTAIRHAGLSATADKDWADLVDELLSKYVEPQLLQPTVLLDYPIEIPSLAKRHRSAPHLVERFEAYCLGMEIANAYTELNDPDEQRARFVAEHSRCDDDREHRLDEEFLRALEYGMPPTGGLGIGVDRLAMILTGAESIKDVILFPALRDRNPDPSPL